MTDSISLSERIYQDPPVIGGVKVREFNTRVKMKIGQLIRLCGVTEEIDQEAFFGALYLIAAPLERMALSTLSKTAYLLDRERFFAELPEAEFQRLVDWFNEMREMERETEVEVHAKPSSVPSETAPPN